MNVFNTQNIFDSSTITSVDEFVSLYEMTRYQLSGKLTIFILLHFF